MPRTSEVVIDLAALESNYRLACEAADGRAIIAVVKADAYGHGAAAVAQRLEVAGCRRFAVLSVEEAAALRAAGVDGEILVLAGPAEADDACAIQEIAATPVVHDGAQLAWCAEAARAAGVVLPVHVEIDTGMRRIGVPHVAAATFAAALQVRGELALAGLFTHFARADELDLGPSEEQLQRFGEACAAFDLDGVEIHTANSAGLCAAPRLPLAGGAVRPGLMLYGVSPAAHLGGAAEALRPVMSLRARVLRVQRLVAGDPVGYGGPGGRRAPAPSRRSASATPTAFPGAWARDGGVGEVEIAGRRAPVTGRVSMDYTGVWLGAHTDVVPGMEACVFGSATLRAEEVAARAGTNAYEVLVGAAARLHRRYVDGNEMDGD